MRLGLPRCHPLFGGLGAAFLLASGLSAQSLGPEVTSWMINTTGIVGYNGLPANVQQVRYSSGYIYINCSDIPAYHIGPWPTDPNVPTNQNFLYKLTRSPQQNTGTATATPLGHAGVLVNGVSIFNPKDAMSYNNQNIWHQNAEAVEGPSFDTCGGHAAPGGEYHHHVPPNCLYSHDSTAHSKIVGFAFDGFPIYAPYGYANTNGTGGVRRIRTSYRLRNITQRTSLPDGTVLSPSQYGPSVSTQYPLGYYVEDFEYVGGLGDLDSHNGRFCVTPDYPVGIYAYFLTIDSTGAGAYPYILGPTYYGVVTAGNTGPGGGHVTISEPVTTYDPLAAPPLLFPPDFAAGVTVTPALSWNSVSGISNYEVEVATDSLFATLVFSNASVADTTSAIGPLTHFTRYWWRVRSLSGQTSGSWSPLRSFITILATPLPVGVLGILDSPTLVWIGSAGASGYRMQLSTDSLFGSTVVDDSTITDTVRSVGPLTDSTEYFWRVKALGSADGSEWSPFAHFIASASGLPGFLVSGGWNMLSIPLKSGERKDVLFPGARSNAFTYLDGAYSAAETLTNGRGYWLKFSSSQVITLGGDPAPVETVAVKAGWNMIGGISSPVAVNSIISIPAGIVNSRFFGYSGSYQAGDTLFPFRGYWVKAGEGGALIIGGNAGAGITQGGGSTRRGGH